jgi:uncharacterized membrane protein
MAGSHTHTHSHDVPDVPVSRGPVTVLLAFLALCAVATVIGVLTLWPDSGKVDALKKSAPYAAPDVTYLDAKVTDLRSPCRAVAASADCSRLPAKLTARLVDGPEKGTSATVDVMGALQDSGLGPGDTVRLMRIPPQAGQEAVYAFDGVVRLTPLLVLGVIFVLVVAGVARLRGILALVSLVFGGAVLFRFMLPALLSGSSGLGVALAGSAAIMFVVLYLAHGPSVRTSAALAGTLLGVAITAVVGEIAVHGATLSGLADENSAQLSAFAGDVSFQGLLMCALVVAGLGVLNDVTITQASSVWELRAAGPTLSRGDLFTSGMRIGRDHIASTIYTIVFAYAGSALAILLLLSLYDRPIIDVLTMESIAEEIVRTLASGIGLALAVPVTTAIAALTVAGPVGLTDKDEVDAYQHRH